MMIKARSTNYDLEGQLAHIRQTQAELELVQQKVINIVKDPKLHYSPAIFVTKLLGVCSVLLLTGAAIGMML